MNQAAVLTEIADILEETCRAHNLPIALTWVSSYPLINNKRTLNIVNSACYVNDLGMQGFLKASDYPFVDDARSSGLRAALAIMLMIREGFYRSNVDYVVEFFLPANLEDLEEKTLMDGISASLRKGCENSKTVIAPGYSVQPLHLFGSLNLNQMSLERNHEDSSEVSFSDWNNFQPVAVSGSSLRHCEQLKMFWCVQFSLSVENARKLLVSGNVPGPSP
ncbi:hypothetical protein Peur_027210 [Populus x canadensis]